MFSCAQFTDARPALVRLASLKSAENNNDSKDLVAAVGTTPFPIAALGKVGGHVWDEFLEYH